MYRFPVLMCVLLVAAQAVFAAPKIVVDSSTYDFGSVQPDEKVEHIFVLRNEGDSDLTISKVQPGCGCTVVKLEKDVLAPGSEVSLQAELDTVGRKGKQHKTIRVESDDPNKPYLLLTLKGDIISRYTLIPERINYGSIQSGDQSTRTVDIISKRRGELAVDRVTCSHEYFAAALETIDEGTSYRVHIKPVKLPTTGKIRSVVKVYVTKPNKQIISIPVSALVIGELAVSPAEIKLTLTPDGSSVTRYVLIGPGATKNFKIESVTSLDASIKVEVKGFSNNKYRIKLSGLSPTEALNGKSVVVKTDAAAIPSFEIPIVVESGSVPATQPSKVDG